MNGSEACANLDSMIRSTHLQMSDAARPGVLLRVIYIHTKPYVSPSVDFLTHPLLSDPNFYLDSLFVRMTRDADSEMVVQTAADCARLRSSVNPSLALVCGYESIELEHAFADLLLHPSLRERE